jgi:glycolate dehydrogenase FAD-binding subunit
MSATASPSLRLELARIAGEAHVWDGPQDLRRIAINHVVPSVMVAPGTAEEVAAVMRFANEHEFMVAPAGGFVHQNIGRVPGRVDVVLLLNRLKQVERYDPGDLTIGVGAGITVADLDRLVTANRQLLPVDPAARDRVTLGGVIATNISGPLQHRFGGIREFLLGVQFVTFEGKIAKAGGRVVKNVAGYDLMKLMTGSFGTLGVIVSANLKVFPRPQQFHSFIAEFVSLRQALDYRDRVLQSPLSPFCLEIASPEARTMIPDGAPPGAWAVYVRAGGSHTVLDRYRHELGATVTREGEGADEEMFWRTAADWEQLWVRDKRNSVLLRVSVPTAAVENALESAAAIASRLGLRWAAVGRASGSFVLSFSGADDVEKAVTAIEQYRHALGPDSMAVIAHCPTVLKSRVDVWGSTPTDVAAMRSVRAALDPKQILNRGRFLV